MIVELSELDIQCAESTDSARLMVIISLHLVEQKIDWGRT